MRFLRTAILAIGIMGLAGACGGSSKPANSTPEDPAMANPCGDGAATNPCGDDAATNPCGDAEGMNPCGDGSDDAANPCGDGNPCGGW